MKSQFTAKKNKIEREDENIEIEGGKDYLKKYPDTKEAVVSFAKKL